MSLSTNYEKFWATGDQNLAEKIFSTNVQYTFNLVKINGKEAVINHILERKRKDNVHYVISDVSTSPELEFHKWNAKATLNEKFGNFLPTNKEFSYSGLTLLRTKNDVISEIIMYSDIDEVLGKQSK